VKHLSAIKKRSMPKPAQAPDKVPGEGGHKAARRHRASVERFVKSGQVEDAARDAEPKTPVEELEMFNAERIGEQRSKGEAPALEVQPERT
jgi:hypothetical protein